MHADPPAWIFPVQACDSNYITLKQIQIIDTRLDKRPGESHLALDGKKDTLVAKFRKARDATPQHDTFKTPQQLWRHLEVSLQYLSCVSMQWVQDMSWKPDRHTSHSCC